MFSGTSSSSKYDASSNDLLRMAKTIKEDSDLPDELQDAMIDVIFNLINTENDISNDKSRINVLDKELELINALNQLRMALQSDHTHYNLALNLLDKIKNIEVNALMLKKHAIVVYTIIKVTHYFGDSSTTNKNEIIEHTKMCALIRKKAQKILRNFTSLFTIPKGKLFLEIFDQELKIFHERTSLLTETEIHGLISEDSLP